MLRFKLCWEIFFQETEGVDFYIFDLFKLDVQSNSNVCTFYPIRKYKKILLQQINTNSNLGNKHASIENVGTNKKFNTQLYFSI